MTVVLLWIGAALAWTTALLTLRNLHVLRRPADLPRVRPKISVLVPARNEAANLDAALDSVLANRGVELEIIVLDDQSDDSTADVVRRCRMRDSRVRLLEGTGPAPGQWGKPAACAKLAAGARGDLLVFMDADVRLSGDALARIAGTLERHDATLLSGIPKQLTVTLGERLVVPLIHFMLLGFLPLDAMRASRAPALGAACGQLLAVKRSAYRIAGGHAAIADRAHDGIALARSFRAHGFRTDLADFTQLATCRMYSSWRDVVAGFAKNAHEGLGSPRGLVPWSALLLMGQTMWLVTLPGAMTTDAAPVLLAAIASLGTRMALARRFGDRKLDVLLHPLGIATLVAIQWYALWRRARGRPVAWKGRCRHETSRSALRAQRQA